MRVGWDREVDRRLQENSGALGSILGILEGAWPGCSVCRGVERGWGEGFSKEVGPAGLHPQWDGGGGGCYWKRKQQHKGDFILKAAGAN